MDSSVFLSSAVIAAVVSGVVSLFGQSSKIHSDNVIGERAKWRTVIRDIAEKLQEEATFSISTGSDRELRVHSINVCYVQLQVRLNPHDDEDVQLLCAVKSLHDAVKVNKPLHEIQPVLEEVIARIAYLLKHDWERAKCETKFWLFRGAAQKRIRYSPESVVPCASGASCCPDKCAQQLVGASKIVGCGVIVALLSTVLLASALWFLNLLPHLEDMLTGFSLGGLNQSHPILACLVSVFLMFWLWLIVLPLNGWFLECYLEVKQRK